MMDDLHPLDLRRVPRNLPSDQYKRGDEYAPFHPQASHVPPDYRDGWNRCWLAAAAPSPVGQVGALPEARTEKEKMERAMAALETLAATWAASFNLREGVAAMMKLRDGENRLMNFIQHCYMEGCYEGRMSHDTSPRAAPSASAPPGWKPQFDAVSVKQEELVLQFCFEIAGPRGKPGSPPDPVRLLEMAQALYEAERESFAPASPGLPQQMKSEVPT